MTKIDVYDRPDNGGDDYILQIRVKNGPLLRAMRMRGFKTVRAFEEAAGISLHRVSRFLNLQVPARTKTGAWAPTVLKMARTLGLPPDCLFPEQHIDKPLPRNNAEVSVSAAELQLLTVTPTDDPEAALMRKQMVRKLGELMSRRLSPRYERVLQLRYGLNDGNAKSLDEISDAMGCGKERVRQMEMQALRKLYSTKGARARVEAIADGRWPADRDRVLPQRHYTSTFELSPPTVADEVLAGECPDG